MNTPNGLTAIKETFAFPFRDPQWKNKFLIGSGITFAGTILPILPWLAILGYGARIARRSAAESVARPAEAGGSEGLADQRENTLPEWNDWGDLFMDGLRQLGVSFLVSLPLMLVFGLMFGMYFFLQIVMIFGQLDAYSDPRVSLLLVFGMFGLSFLTMGLTLVLTPVTYLFIPAAAAHVAVTRRFGDFFRAGQWLRVLRANLGGYLSLLFFLAGLYVVYMLTLQLLYLTLILCLVLPVAAAVLGFYGMTLFYHLSGQAYAGGTKAVPARAVSPLEDDGENPPTGDDSPSADLK